MAKIEKLELDAHREQLVLDVKTLVERYHAIFEWNVPDIDEVLSHRLIIEGIRDVLDGIEKTLIEKQGS